MSNRKIREIVIKQEVVEADGATYEYALIMRESARVASYRIPLYSIKVRMVTPSGEVTSAEASDVFSDIGKALVFYDRMVEHLATPLNLPYILEDETV